MWSPVPIPNIVYSTRAERLAGYPSRTVVYSVYRISDRADFDIVLDRYARVPILRRFVPYATFLWSGFTTDIYGFFSTGACCNPLRGGESSLHSCVSQASASSFIRMAATPASPPPPVNFGLGTCTATYRRVKKNEMRSRCVRAVRLSRGMRTSCSGARTSSNCHGSTDSFFTRSINPSGRLTRSATMMS